MELLDKAVTLLAAEGKLPANYKPHVLKGNYNGSIVAPLSCA
jgi:mRNA-degrading endonuclease YafQ of YafQ-DinJ toxin-antitoxin module